MVAMGLTGRCWVTYGLSFVVASSVVAMYAIDLIVQPVSMRVACDVFHAEWALVCSE